MRHDKRYDDLDTLDDFELVHGEQDIRGRPLVDKAGRKFGTIDDLIVDRKRERVVAVELEGGVRTPVEPLEIYDNAVVYGDEASAYSRRDNDYGPCDKVHDEEVRVIDNDEVALGSR